MSLARGGKDIWRLRTVFYGAAARPRFRTAKTRSCPGKLVDGHLDKEARLLNGQRFPHNVLQLLRTFDATTIDPLTGCEAGEVQRGQPCSDCQGQAELRAEVFQCLVSAIPDDNTA